MEATPSPPNFNRHAGASSISPSFSNHSDNAENNFNIDLAALESQVRALESQKAHLTAQLTTIRSTNTTASLPTPPPSTISPSTADAEIINTALITSNQHSTALLESNYRLSGLTSFLVRDPSPGGETLLGVRIESFTNGQFGAPHYLILSTRAPANIKGGVGPGGRSLTLRHATIPPHFDLSGLAGRYLPVGVPAQEQRLDTLVRELRTRIARWNWRGEVLEGLRSRGTMTESNQEDLASSARDRLGLGEMRSMRWDEARINIEIEWTGASGELAPDVSRRVVGNVRLLEDGGVEKAVVMQYGGDQGGVGERLKKVERRLKVEGLVGIL